jgi:cobalt-zinc-cadmium efflux system protein
MASRPSHVHIPVVRVLLAVLVTGLAASVEMAGSAHAHTLFLAADASHLLAHVGIFAVLLIPLGRWHQRGEDAAAIAVLTVVALVALGIAFASVRTFTGHRLEPLQPSFMLLSLLGLAANLTTAYLFAGPARTRWSFRAALAHELADGVMTLAGILGALVIELSGWAWVDPVLSLAIAAWLGAWSARLLLRRARLGSEVWTLENVSWSA